MQDSTVLERKKQKKLIFFEKLTFSLEIKKALPTISKLLISVTPSAISIKIVVHWCNSYRWLGSRVNVMNSQ